MLTQNRCFFPDHHNFFNTYISKDRCPPTPSPPANKKIDAIVQTEAPCEPLNALSSKMTTKQPDKHDSILDDYREVYL